MAGNVLLIVSRGELRNQIAQGLREKCIAVEVADGAAQALDGPAPCVPDVAVCSVELAVPEPLATCERLRGGCDGVIMIGCRGRRADAVQFLRAGADDFVAFPFRPAELVARARALVRRLREFNPRDESIISRGDVVIDPGRHVVTVRGAEVALTPKEFELLQKLATGSTDLVPREELLRDIWGVGAALPTRTLDVHVGRLREKIERDPSCPKLIVTVPRLGYRLAA